MKNRRLIRTKFRKVIENKSFWNLTKETNLEYSIKKIKNNEKINLKTEI